MADNAHGGSVIEPPITAGQRDVEAPVIGAVAAESAAVRNRLRRAHGQLAGVLRMVEESRDLEATVAQLKAVSRAVDRAAVALVTAELRRRLEAEHGPEAVEAVGFDELEERLVALP